MFKFIIPVSAIVLIAVMLISCHGINHSGKRHQPNAGVVFGDKIEEAYIPGDNYVLIETEEQGKPMFMIVNEALSSLYPKKLYGYFCEIDILMDETTEDQLPTDKEAEVLNAFEDEVMANIIGDPDTPNVRLAARVTWTGQRELYFRVNDPDIVGQYLQKLSESENYPRHFRFVLEADKNWEKTDWLFMEALKAGKKN